MPRPTAPPETYTLSRHDALRSSVTALVGAHDDGLPAPVRLVLHPLQREALLVADRRSEERLSRDAETDRAPRDLHSFPTRRSSELGHRARRSPRRRPSSARATCPPPPAARGPAGCGSQIGRAAQQGCRDRPRPPRPTLFPDTTLFGARSPRS